MAITDLPKIGKDFYMRFEGDPNYIQGILESNDPLENAIQQVRMTLLTRKGEVLGEDIGFDAEGYLFDFEGVTKEAVEREANDQIANYVLLSKPYNITADAFILSDASDPYKVAMGLDVKVNGQSTFAALFDS